MIHPLRQASAYLMALAWGTIVIDLAANILTDRLFTVALVAAATVTLIFGLSRLASRVEASLLEHTERVEKVTREHAQAMKEHILTVERLFQLGIRAKTQAMVDAVRTHDHLDEPTSATGTGPFTLYKGAGS